MIKAPLRFEKAKFEDVPVNIQTLVKNIKNSRKGIYISGACGTGKTHIAYAIGKYVQDTENINVFLYNIPNLLRHLKQDFNDNNKNLDEENTNFGKLLNFKGLLIIDDLGTEKLSEWVEEVLYTIINERYENVLPTIFTSNLAPAALVEKFGDRIVSRIIGSCDLVELKGEDKRL